MADSEEAGAGREMRRHVGALLMVAGTGLVLVTVLAGAGILPIWRPTVPEPVMLRNGGWAGLGAQGAARERPPAYAGEVPGLAGGETIAAAPRATAGPRQRTSSVEAEDATPEAAADATPIVLPGPLAYSSQPAIRLSLPPTPVPPPPPPGLPVRLAIPSIRVDAPVVELDRKPGPSGALQWETVPFVAGYYPITGLVGAPANVVLSGHVHSQDQGNVFRDLYRLQPGDPLVVGTALGQFTYRVADLRLVKPWEVDALAPSAEPRLTLVTCAGAFDFRTRTFSERLLVVGELVS
jgi:LPXTG-site transpeptidase (sortase) family protein